MKQDTMYFPSLKQYVYAPYRFKRTLWVSVVVYGDKDWSVSYIQIAVEEKIKGAM